MGTKYQQNSVGNLSVIYLRKVRWYFVDEFVCNPSVIGDYFYRHSIGNLLQIYFVGIFRSNHRPVNFSVRFPL